jgi:glycosyltransferase involved in cell wall biosynthesis
VVVPCFNQARFLREAILSAGSNRATVEVIVVDDGSTDGTRDVALAAGAQCISQPNRGVAAARNAGLAAARGALVVFLDADDRLLAGAIDTGVAALDAAPAAAFVWGRVVALDESGALGPAPNHAPLSGDCLTVFLRDNPIWTPAAAMFRTNAVRAVGAFAGGCDAAADYDLYLRLARAAPGVDHGHAVAAYRRHAGNMSSSAARMLRETVQVLRRHRPDDTARLEAWRAGLARFRDFYGTQLVEEIRRDLRARAIGRAARRTLVLAHHAPRVLIRELFKKARVTARRDHAGRARPEAETSSPISRAERSSGS